jgi:hypothetical protein
MTKQFKKVQHGISKSMPQMPPFEMKLLLTLYMELYLSSISFKKKQQLPNDFVWANRQSKRGKVVKIQNAPSIIHHQSNLNV